MGKKKNRAGGLVVDASMDARVAAQAEDAMRELWDRVVDRATDDPRSRLVTPAMMKASVEERLAAYFGPGVLPPRVEVRMNADRTSFDVSITPAQDNVVRQAGNGS